MPAIHCDHCGYDLIGIAPDDATSPQMLKCPECGKRSDIYRVPRSHALWWRFPLAVLAGAGVIFIVHTFGTLVFPGMTGRSSQGVDTFEIVSLLSILLGGVISTLITWRHFRVFQRWSAQQEGVGIRYLGPLLVEFVVFCLLDSTVAGVIAFLFSIANG